MTTHSSFQSTSSGFAIPALFFSLLLAGPARGQTINTQIGDLEFESGYPQSQTVQILYDELDFQRAVQAYLWALPMASYGAMADAHHELGADTHTVVIADKLAEPRHKEPFTPQESDKILVVVCHYVDPMK